MVGSTVSNEVSLVQNTGQSTTSVMSQKAVSDALSTKVGKSEVVQSTGTSTTAVMSQKAVSDIVGELESQVIYDVTANNSGTTFDSLSALLSNENLSTLIPSEVRCGGMSIRFVQSSDNKYVQYRLMSDTFNTTEANWQGVDSGPKAFSTNLIESGAVSIIQEDLELLNKGITGLIAYIGSIDGARLVNYENAKYSVFKLKAGMSVLKAKKSASTVSFLAVLKTFEYDPAKPYTLDYATGFSTRTELTSNRIVTINIPSDANYILISRSISSGVDNTPSVFSIDGVDYAITYDERLRFSSGEPLGNIAIGTGITNTSEALAKEKNVYSYVIGKLYKDAIAQTFPISGKCIYTDGTTSTASEYVLSDYIKVSLGDMLIVSGYSYFHILYAYNSDKQPLRSLLTENTKYTEREVVIENTDIAYVRCSASTSSSYPTPSCLLIVSKYAPVEYIDKLEVKTLSLYKQNSTTFWLQAAVGKDIVKYKFVKLYKKWDSLPYVDSGGVTQNATDVVSTDVWDCSEMYVNDVYVAQGNTNFIYKTTNSNYHVGAGHGCEVAIMQRFNVDGSIVDVDNLAIGTTVYGEYISFEWKSEVYQCDNSSGGNTPDVEKPVLDENGNKVVDSIHFFSGILNLDGSMEFDNKLSLEKSLSFTQLHGAMLECKFPSLNRVMVNNSENSENTIALVDGSYVYTPVNNTTVNLGNGTVAANKVKMYSNGYNITEEMQQINPERWNKNRVMFNTYTGYAPRLKCYFMPFASDESEFAQGTIFEVKAKRRIEMLSIQ